MMTDPIIEAWLVPDVVVPGIAYRTAAGVQGFIAGDNEHPRKAENAGEAVGARTDAVYDEVRGCLPSLTKSAVRQHLVSRLDRFFRFSYLFQRRKSCRHPTSRK